MISCLGEVIMLYVYVLFC